MDKQFIYFNFYKEFKINNNFNNSNYNNNYNYNNNSNNNNNNNHYYYNNSLMQFSHLRLLQEIK